MAETNHQFDTSVELVTPENIAFRYHIAGPFQRLWPYAIDGMIRVAFLGVLLLALSCAGLVLPGGPLSGVGLGMVVWFLAEWFYGGLFEAIWNGRRPASGCAACAW
jgi:uncharacterized RDD family membrane protein YckC